MKQYDCIDYKDFSLLDCVFLDQPQLFFFNSEYMVHNRDITL